MNTDSSILSSYNRSTIRRMAIVVMLLVMLMLFACLCGTVQLPEQVGRSPQTAIQPDTPLNVLGSLVIKASGIERGVEVPDNYGAYLTPPNGYEDAYVSISIRCESTPLASICTADAGDFVLLGSKNIAYEEKEQLYNVPDHLPTIWPDDPGDAIGFDFGTTNIPDRVTRDAVLVFRIAVDDSEFVLQYKGRYYLQVPES